jgi:hypothetical protein
MEEKEKYSTIKNKSRSKEAATLNFIRCLTSSQGMKTNKYYNQ